MRRFPSCHLFFVFLLSFGICAERAFANDAHSFREETILFTLRDGTNLQGVVRFPRGAGNGKLPVIFIFGGFQNAGHVLDLVNPPVPVILASFDYPFSPPRKIEFPGSLRYAGEVKKMVRQTIDGITGLKKRVLQFPQADPERISIIGASLGAPFAIEAAARNPDIRGIIIVHGFGEIAETSERQLVKYWDSRPGLMNVLGRPLAWLISRLGWLYLGRPEPEVSARRLVAEQKVLFFAAETDSFIPAEASQALWKGILGSKAVSSRVITPGDHLQPGSEKLISIILGQACEWMKRTGLI